MRMVFPQGGRVCKIPWLIFHVKKKYKTKVMGHVFQVEWWEKHLHGLSLWFIMAKEIGKGKEALIGILFMKIKENKRKGT